LQVDIIPDWVGPGAATKPELVEIWLIWLEDVEAAVVLLGDIGILEALETGTPTQ
jgi:hypothetical protein